MQPHELRVHAEKQDLADKVEKLDAFIKGVTFIGLDDFDKQLLRTQLAVMESYGRILDLRTRRFTTEIVRHD